MDARILGDGPLGQAIAAALTARGDRHRLLGRPVAGAHDAAVLAGADVAFEASRGPAVAGNVAALVEAGVRRIVIATTAWDADRAVVARLLERGGAAAVAAPNLSLGMACFGRLVEDAVARLGRLPGFDPYIVEWHRRSKADRPSGTARALAARMVAASEGRIDRDGLEVLGVRAGANPGSHLVGFDGPGESIELRHTSRDRTAYAAGALAAADWLCATERRPGLHGFDPVVDAVLNSAAPSLQPALATAPAEAAMAAG